MSAEIDTREIDRQVIVCPFESNLDTSNTTFLPLEQSNQPLSGYTQEYANEMTSRRVARNPAAISAANAFIMPAAGRFFSRIVPEVVSQGASKLAASPVIGTGLRQLGSEGMYMGKSPFAAGVGAFSTLYMGKKVTIG
ncbi:hypothetical protein DdX_15923 [Ditylenchus destructor]|uniref:Uncharacterized protein n=1 Tax=Ditylenchus destructor TaxID=166010 RepID=A0AAD4MRY6_9BILA|nr:hypothetical protein DdX_15923 [Ditylenchus destructor]